MTIWTRFCPAYSWLKALLSVMKHDPLGVIDVRVRWPRWKPGMTEILSTVMLRFPLSVLEATAASVRLESNTGREISRNSGKKNLFIAIIESFTFEKCLVKPLKGNLRPTRASGSCTLWAWCAAWRAAGSGGWRKTRRNKPASRAAGRRRPMTNQRNPKRNGPLKSLTLHKPNQLWRHFQRLEHLHLKKRPAMTAFRPQTISHLASKQSRWWRPCPAASRRKSQVSSSSSSIFNGGWQTT